jgi:hypothetical protein
MGRIILLIHLKLYFHDFGVFMNKLVYFSDVTIS